MSNALTKKQVESINEISFRIKKTGVTTPYSQKSVDTTRIKTNLEDSQGSILNRLSMDSHDVIQTDDSKLEGFNTEIQSLRNQLTELQNKMEVLETEKNTLELEKGMQNNHFEKISDELEKENKKLNLDIERLLQEKQTIDNELESSKQQVKDLLREKGILQEDKERCSQQLHTELMSLTGRNKQIESQEADLRSKLNVLEDKNKTLEKDLSKLNETKLKSMIFEESLKIKEDENQRLDQENQKLKAELNSFLKQAKDLAEEKEILLRDKEKLNSEAEDLRAQLVSSTAIWLEKELSLQKQVENNILENAHTKPIDINGPVLRFKDKRIEAQDFKEFYDCRILADSFYSLLQNKSWLIEYSNHENYKLLRTQNTTKVAVLGYENSGKSFLLSKLTDSELPQGTLMKTTGICLKYPSEKYLPWTALDTPGTNISVKTQQMMEKLATYFEEKNLSDDDRMRMLLGDNILMENLLQKFVVKHAQVLLVVVGKLHRGDQKLINRIKKLQGKRIMIVHNLLDVQNTEDIEKIIQEDIYETFSVTEKPFYLEKIESGKGERMNTKVYLENDEKNGGAIEHLVVAHEGSPAGDFYNESTIKYIKTSITSLPFAQPFDLVDAFLKHLNENLKNYLHSKNTTIGDPFIVEKDETGAPNALKLNHHLQYDLKLSSADEFGLIRTFSREGLEHVPYTVKIVHEESDDKKPKALRFEFEIVGHYEDKDIKCKVHQFSNNQVRLEVRGKSEDNPIRAEDSIIENTRKFGEFTIVTELIMLEGYVINLAEHCKRIKSEVPGLKTLEWTLHPPAEESLD